MQTVRFWFATCSRKIYSKNIMFPTGAQMSAFFLDYGKEELIPVI